MHKRSSTIAALLLLTILSGCGTSAIAGEVTGSYTNAYARYTIDVPIGWRVEPAQTLTATATLYSYPETGPVRAGEPITKIEIYIEPLPASLGLRDAMALYPAGPDVRIVSERLVEIGGRPALQQTIYSNGSRLQQTSLVHESKLITLIVYGDTGPAQAVVASLELD